MKLESDDFTEQPQLSAVQKWMQSVLITPLGEEDSQPWRHLPAHLQKTPVESLIVGTDKLSARGHLHIYQSSYILRLRDCMAKQFSALEYALGEEVFQHFADQYLQTHPSSSYTLSDLGKKFPEFLQATRPDADSEEKETWPDFMIELADYEYAVNILFDIQAEPDDRNVKEASEQTPETQLKLRPVFQLFQHTHPISGYYRAFIADKQPELPFPAPSFSVLLRKDYQLGIFDLHEAQFLFLRMWQELQDLDKTKQRFAERHGFATAALEQAWLQWKALWTTQGFFMEG